MKRASPRLSVALTGFGAEELAATGMADSYRTTVLQQIGGVNLGLLLAALAEADGDPVALADPALLEAARLRALVPGRVAGAFGRGLPLAGADRRTAAGAPLGRDLLRARSAATVSEELPVR